MSYVSKWVFSQSFNPTSTLPVTSNQAYPPVSHIQTLLFSCLKHTHAKRSQCFQDLAPVAFWRVEHFWGDTAHLCSWSSCLHPPWQQLYKPAPASHTQGPAQGWTLPSSQLCFDPLMASPNPKGACSLRLPQSPRPTAQGVPGPTRSTTHCFPITGSRAGLGGERMPRAARRGPATSDQDVGVHLSGWKSDMSRFLFCFMCPVLAGPGVWRQQDVANNRASHLPGTRSDRFLRVKIQTWNSIELISLLLLPFPHVKFY